MLLCNMEGAGLQVERQRMLRKRRPQHTSSPGEQTGFQRRWWGRKQPLEPDPRNVAASVARSLPPSPPHVDRLRRLSIEDHGSGYGRVTTEPALVHPPAARSST